LNYENNMFLLNEFYAYDHACFWTIK
jgi:hypothetical protein